MLWLGLWLEEGQHYVIIKYDDRQPNSSQVAYDDLPGALESQKKNNGKEA